MAQAHNSDVFTMLPDDIKALLFAGYVGLPDMCSLSLAGSASAGIPFHSEDKRARVLGDINDSTKLSETQKGFMKAHVDELVGALTLGEYTRKYNYLASMASPLQVVGLIYPQIMGIREHGLSPDQVRVSNYDHHTNTAIRDGLDYEVVAGLDYQQIVGIREHNLSREQVSVPNYGYHTNAAIRNGLAYQDVAGLDDQQLQALRAKLNLEQPELQAFRAQQQTSTDNQGRAGDSCCVIC